MSRKNGQITPVFKSIRILNLGAAVSYVQKKYRCRNTVEVKQYHTARYGAPGQPRQKKIKPTPEAVKRQNQRRKEEHAARIIEANFTEGDYVRTLTFAPAQRPADMKEAQRIFKDFYQRLNTANDISTSTGSQILNALQEGRGTYTSSATRSSAGVTSSKRSGHTAEYMTS